MRGGSLLSLKDDRVVHGLGGDGGCPKGTGFCGEGLVGSSFGGVWIEMLNRFKTKEMRISDEGTVVGMGREGVMCGIDDSLVGLVNHEGRYRGFRSGGFFFRDGVWDGVFWSWDFEGGKKGTSHERWAFWWRWGWEVKASLS